MGKNAVRSITYAPPFRRRTEGHAADGCQSVEGAAEANQTTAQLDSPSSGRHQSWAARY